MCPCQVKVSPWHIVWLSVIAVYLGFTVTVIVTTESHPLVVCSVSVSVKVPDVAPNVCPCQVKVSPWHIVWLSVIAVYLGFTVTVIVTTESQPLVVCSVSVSVKVPDVAPNVCPCQVKVSPWHIVWLSLIAVYLGFTVTVIVTTESHPFAV